MMKSLLRRLPYRWREMFWQLRAGQATEVDIEFFRQLNQCSELVLDIGANRGQFALSLLKLNKHLRVLSMEPNPTLKRILALVQLLHPIRFRYLPYGAGDSEQKIPLHIPYSGSTDLSPNASLVPDEFEKDYVRERLESYASASNGQYDFTTVDAKIITVDSLDLSPIAIKIDVEGYEMPALKGMINTLQRHHPMLMIEMNNQDQFLPWLSSRGYSFFQYNDKTMQLEPLQEGEWTLNVFCLHPKSKALQFIPKLSF